MRTLLLVGAPVVLLAQEGHLLEKLPQTWYVAYDDAERLMRQGRYREALQHYRQALRLSDKAPGDKVLTYQYNHIRYHPYLGMARAALALGELATAREALQASTRINREPAAQREELLRELARRTATVDPPKPAPRGLPPAALQESQPTAPPASTPPGGTLTSSPSQGEPTEALPQAKPPLPPPRPAPVRALSPAPQAPPQTSSTPEPPAPSAPPVAKPPSPSRTLRWVFGLSLGALALAGFLLLRRRSRHGNPYGVDLRRHGSSATGRSQAGDATGDGAASPGFAFGRTPAPAHLGPYRVLEVLGRGGCATTYLGVHERTGQQAALKVPHPHVLADAEFRQRFWREAELGRLLDHPRIPQMLESGTEQDPWLAMAFVEGITLETHLLDQGQLRLNQAIHIALEVTEALAHAHARGVVHRDLKPSNIMLGSRGAMVLDFGIARLTDTANTATALLLGTPAYFAPEGLQSARVGPAADRYALGILLYEMLTGQKPFTGDNPFHILEQHRTQPLPEVNLLRPEASPRLVRLVERLAQKDPTARPEDLEVLELLRTLAAQHPVEGR